MPIDRRQSSLRKRIVACRFRVAPLILIALWCPIAALAQDQPSTPATPEMVRFAREEAVRDLAVAERQLVRAEEYRRLEIDALLGAEHATDPASRKSWLDSAREHAAAALRLEESSREVRAKAEATEARANRLAMSSDRALPAP